MSKVTLDFIWGHLSRKQTVRRFINDDGEDRLCLSGDEGMCSSSSPGLQSNLIYEFQNIFKMEASILTFTSQHVILVAPQICERYFKIQFSIKPSVRAKSGDYQIREIKTTRIFHGVDAKLKLKAKV